MWVLMYILILSSMVLSSSPFFGMAGLFGMSVLTATALGMKNSWLLTIMVLVYVGGVMVMFTYMTSAVSSSKILALGGRPIIIISGAVVFYTIISFNSPALTVNLWTSLGFVSEELPFLLFLVNYMIFALVSVFVILNKEEGPMKMK